MSEAPFMQLYVADYLGDTRHLTTEQHGAYLLLLMTMWRHGGSLPNDTSKLARIAGVSARRWHLICDEVMAFFTVEGEAITQKRLVEEYQKAVSKSEKRSVAGKLGGEAKALKNKEPSLANARAEPKHSSEPEPYREEISSDISKRSRAGDAETKAEILREFVGWYAAYPHKVGRAEALKAWPKARSKTSLDELVEGVRRYIAAKPPDRSFCNPATWLNGERWLDQPAPPVIGAQHVRSHDRQQSNHVAIDDAFANIEARRNSRGFQEPDRSRQPADAFGIPTRELSFDRGEDGSFGGHQDRPYRVAGSGRH